MKQVVLLSVLSLFLFTGCQVVGGGLRVEGGYPHAGHVPLHAPAHGLRHRYHYYPNAEFYFDVGRNLYFYLDTRSQWTFSVDLPLHLHSHLRHGFVEIEMDDDRPYRRHKYYKNKYKKHKYKNKRKFKQNNKYKKKKHRNKHDEYRDEEDDGRRHKRRRYERE